jgi:hypothetical protein
MHTPPEHAEFMHGEAVPHVPFAVQVWTPLPEHCVSPGPHTPVQAPLMHVWSLQPAGVPQVPAEVHVCTPLPVHWVAPGVHVTHVLLRHTGVDPVHVVCVCQVPEAVQVWMELPRHCV